MNPDSRIALTNSNTLRMVDYNSNSEVQALAASKLSELIKRYATKVLDHFPRDATVSVCEYGCATGGSSIMPIKAIEDASGRRKIKMIMNDLPMNDWDTLQATIEPKFPNIDFEYIAKTMYSPIAKDASIHLGYSCFAQHWLDNGAQLVFLAIPCGQISSPSINSSVNPGEKLLETIGKRNSCYVPTRLSQVACPSFTLVAR